MLELVAPSKKYKKSFLEASEEYKNTDSGQGIDQSMKEICSEIDFNKFVEEKIDHSKGINIANGYVPASEFWLIEGDEFIGRTSIRHSLNENLKKIGGHIGYTIRPSRRKMGYGTKILQLSLPKAKELGIDKALLTCDKDNIGSAKIIEKNGGVLENELEQSEGKPPKLRYWINFN
ncbi:TPA: GNAT family acetyltransferase [Candidatus Berkelbacteria bacterium]|uniref:GCN5-related N-acetyltransferase n=1 Tax=Berkelbacteria bacterium GW2011_GWE1_39_12 TaxID=1618337 RepID=A0A0G4B3E7_9BACT|nr:MAG: GCN5-related N-acetyltransferase [Berkelbacteria bacterium GW2011_GWE1_39_12]HBO61063.1 GNAT family acetyltransferase [Candidatus Berkelbacteria bacterium]